MLTLYIIRGLPGSGKSTLGEILARHGGDIPGNCYAADDYFMVGDEYQFDPSKLGQAHTQCQEQVRASLEAGRTCAVANTFSRHWEFQPYVEMAKELGVRYFLIDLFDNNTPIEELYKRNTHGVPKHVYLSMAERWEK